MSIAVKTSGYGSSINGGELLLLSLATCFCNDIYREAAKKNITVSGVEVIFTGEFGGEGDTDQIAEIHNTLRKGLNITLRNS